jgi:Nop53 (60S ribosomal biogenesis)
VWNKIHENPTPEDVPPPATLLYAKSIPAQPPSTIRSDRHLLRPRKAVKAVTVPDEGQSYNPTLEGWSDLIQRTAVEEQKRLDKIAQKEWVPEPEPETLDTPKIENMSEDELEEQTGETFLAKPVQLVRKTRSQRNKQLRQLEQVFSFNIVIILGSPT